MCGELLAQRACFIFCAWDNEQRRPTCPINYFTAVYLHSSVDYIPFATFLPG